MACVLANAHKIPKCIKAHIYILTLRQKFNGRVWKTNSNERQNLSGSARFCSTGARRSQYELLTNWRWRSKYFCRILQMKRIGCVLNMCPLRTFIIVVSKHSTPVLLTYLRKITLYVGKSAKPV